MTRAAQTRNPLADLNATTDMVAARLATLLQRIAAMPAGVADEVQQAAAELEPYVAILEQLGADPDNPVPAPAELPRSTMAAPATADAVMPAGEPFPDPEQRGGGR
jgi:hypothetical protein